MTERHHYKYVVLDSSKENGNAVQARFNVQIPHGITNASRVCVKSFSMPNVIHSVYGDLKTVRFVEFYRPTAGGNWVYEIFRFTLPDGYDETADLVNNMQAKFTNNEITRESDGTVTFTHSGQTDTATTVTITHDMSSARKIADEVAMLFEGKIIWHGPANIIDNSGNDHVDQFVHGRADGPIQPAI